MGTPRTAMPSPPHEVPNKCPVIRVDARGRSVPFSIVAAKEAVTRVDSAQCVEVLCDARASISLTALCRSRNWPVRVTESDEGSTRLIIEKTPLSAVSGRGGPSEARSSRYLRQREGQAPPLPER